MTHTFLKRVQSANYLLVGGLMHWHHCGYLAFLMKYFFSPLSCFFFPSLFRSSCWLDCTGMILLGEKVFETNDTKAGVSVFLGDFLLQALGATPVMMEVAKKYVRIRAVGLPLATIACAMYGLCVGKGDTKTPLVVTVYLSAVLNIFFDWLLCAQVPWGAAGAAWATVAAQVSSSVAYFIIMRRKKQLPLPDTIRQALPSWSVTWLCWITRQARFFFLY